jgi:HK97 family phage major capsid protein
MRSKTGNIILRKIGGVFDACRASANPLFGTYHRSAPSIASTAFSMSLFLLVPLILVALLAAVVHAHPVATIAAVSAAKLSPLSLVGFAVAGEIEHVSNELVEKRDRFAVKQREIADIMLAAKDGPSRYDFSRKNVLDKLGAKDASEAFEKIQQRRAELEGLSVDLQNAEAKSIEDAAAKFGTMLDRPAAGTGLIHPASDMKVKSLGELFVESKAYVDGYLKHRQREIPAIIDIGLKTLMQTTAGLAPESVRSGLIVDAATRPVQMLDYIPVQPINQAVDKYMEETTFTPGAAETAEAAAYQESVYAYTERTSPVQKITDSLPVTDEQLEDAPVVAARIDQRLRFGLRQRADGQSLNGDGTGSNLTGIYAKAGIQSQAKAADTVLDAFFKALTLVRFTGRALPNLGVFHPTDWQGVRLLKDSQGRYIMGDPSVPGPTSLFGTSIVLGDAKAAGTALVGDFQNFIYISERRGIEVQIGYVNDDFSKGKKTLRADMRIALTITRAAAFCKITGL